MTMLLFAKTIQIQNTEYVHMEWKTTIIIIMRFNIDFYVDLLYKCMQNIILVNCMHALQNITTWIPIYNDNYL